MPSLPNSDKEEGRGLSLHKGELFHRTNDILKLKRKNGFLQDGVLYSVCACCVRICACSHHYESEVVSVGVAVICALDL